MSNHDKAGRTRANFDDENDDAGGRPQRPKIDPDERDEYVEWKQERGSRGRKRRDKADGRHQKRNRDRDIG